MSDVGVSSEHDFGRLFVRHQTCIYGYIRSLVASRNDAEDVLQDTASVLWRKFGEFQPGTSFLAWALEAARYQVLTFQKKQRKATSFQFSEALVQSLADETVTQSVRLADLRTDLEECVGRLATRDRDIFERRYSGDVTTRELALQLGKPPTTLYNALARIRRVLAECLTAALRQSEGA